MCHVLLQKLEGSTEHQVPPSCGGEVPNNSSWLCTLECSHVGPPEDVTVTLTAVLFVDVCLSWGEQRAEMWRHTVGRYAAVETID